MEKYLSHYFGISICLTSCIRTMGNLVGNGHDALLHGANVSGADITGIDVPVLIQTPFVSNGTIMIIEQDPLRNIKKYLSCYNKATLAQNAIVGTPNALHYHPVFFYLSLVEELLKLGWNVYMTDAYKVYAPSLSKSLDRWGMGEKWLLGEEICQIRPQTVLLFGKEAKESYKDVMQGLTGLSAKKVEMPHRSAWASVWRGVGVFPATDCNKLTFVLNAI